MRIFTRILVCLAVAAVLASLPAFGQSVPFRFALSLPGAGSVTAAGRDGCSWTKETIRCAETPCTVAITAAGVANLADPESTNAPGLHVVFRAGDAARPWLVCKAAACSMVIEHKDGSIHALPMNRDGQRRMDEFGELDVLIEQ